LENQGTGSFRQEGGYPVDHVGGDLGGEKSGPEGRGIDIVEAGFDVEEEGGDLQSGSLKSLYFVSESKAGVGGAKSWQGAALVGVEKAFGSGDGSQPDCHHTFEDLGDGFEEDDYAEGGGGVVGGFSGLV